MSQSGRRAGDMGAVRLAANARLQSSSASPGLLYEVSLPGRLMPLVSCPNDTRGFQCTALQSAAPELSYIKENAE